MYDFMKIKNGDKLPPTAIIAVGAAMEGLGRSGYSVNLSPFCAAIEKRQAFGILAVQVIAAVAVISAAYLLSGLLLKGGYSKLRQLEQASASLPIMTSTLEAEGLMKKKDATLQTLRCFQLMQSDRISLARQLSAIAFYVKEQKKQPAGLWIKKIVFKETVIKNESGLPVGFNREMVLSGGAFSSDSAREMDYIHSFLDAITSDAGFTRYFNDIELGSVDRTSVSNEWVADFTISARSQAEPKAGRRGRR
jgi:hypothetical protein